MRWPALRFERFFERHLRRKFAEQLAQERISMIAAIASNPNWDNEKNLDARTQRLRNIDVSYKEGVELIYAPRDRAAESAPDPMATDPLFRPLRNRAVELSEQVSRPEHPNEGGGQPLIEAMS